SRAEHRHRGVHTALRLSLTSYELSGWTSRIHWPNHRSPKMYQAHPSPLAPMIATTAITIDKIASLRMAMPNLHAKIKQQRGGFRDFFEVGVGKHRLEIGVKRRPARPSSSRVTRLLQMIMLEAS